MWKLLYVFIALLFVSASVSIVGWRAEGRNMETEVTHTEPFFMVEEGVPPDVSATSWVLFDMETGEILLEKNPDGVMPVASVSKLITALVALDSLDLDATTTVSALEIVTEGRAGRLKIGDTMTIREFLFPLLLESSNDAAEVLAQSRGDREGFVTMMNSTGKSLDLPHTTFEDPSGLSAGNVSTANELMLLLRHIYSEKRYILDITSLTHYVGESNNWQNNNPVVEAERYRGGKHGFTPEAGRTFAGVFMQSLANAERPLGIVLLQSDDIKKDVEELRRFAETSVRYTSPR